MKEKDIQPKEQHKTVFNELVRQKANGELLNKGKAIKKAGYSEGIQHNPKKVIETRGFQALVDKTITDKTLIDYLAADLKEKSGNRLGELKLAFELKGELSNKVDINVNQEVEQQLNIIKGLIDGVKTTDDR